MFRERERLYVRKENRGIPETVERMLQAVGVPAENPRNQKRVAEIARNHGAEVFRQRPCGDDGQQTKEADDGGGLDATGRRPPVRRRPRGLSRLHGWRLLS